MTIDQTRGHADEAVAARTPLTDRIAALRRPSGGLAMLAIDQREALRAMMSDAAGGAEVSDDEVRAFKVNAARILTPYASAVLVDHQFGWDAVLDEGAVDPGCALISSADLFISGDTELVGDSVIDPDVDLHAVAAQGAAAAKLLVLWREDEPASGRVDMVRDFVDRCHRAGLAAIIEPVVRARRDGAPSDLNGPITTAAQELGSLGADLYKAQVPFGGRADDDELLAACRAITDAVASPWVVLSSGVAASDFPRAVRLAVAAGASGFLAGRAVWAPSLAAADTIADLTDHATIRLQDLGACVDEALTARA
jgi:sulfofructosephosphate aldolase